MQIAPGDWDALEQLAGRVGFPVDRVGSLRRRLDSSPPRPGSPYSLLVGRPDAGIELLLARWIAPDAAEELQRAGDRPLIIGPAPGEVRPRLGAWPSWKWKRYENGHLLVLRTSGKVPADIVAQLASLGYLDQIVLVGRLNQAMHQYECDIAMSLATTAATARVLLVALPGEEPTESELAEVTALCVTRMRQVGFRSGRCLGAGVWFTSAEQRPGTIGDVARFLRIESDESSAGRSGMAREAVAALLHDLKQHAEQSGAPVLAPIDEDEADRLTKELANHLGDLGKELQRQIQRRRDASTDFVRGYALDALRGWSAHTSIEGHWLKYVDRLRPGMQAAFLVEAESSTALLQHEPGREPDVPVLTSSPYPGGAPFFEWLLVQAKRFGVALVCGLTAYLLTFNLLTAEKSGLPPLVISVLNYAALVIGAVLGFSVATKIFRGRPLFLPTSPPAASPMTPPAVLGFEQLERRLTAWFSRQIRTKPSLPADDCRALAQRLGMQE
jgi:hypothetical protein